MKFEPVPITENTTYFMLDDEHGTTFMLDRREATELLQVLTAWLYPDRTAMIERALKFPPEGQNA